MDKKNGHESLACSDTIPDISSAGSLLTAEAKSSLRLAIASMLFLMGAGAAGIVRGSSSPSTHRRIVSNGKPINHPHPNDDPCTVGPCQTSYPSYPSSPSCSPAGCTTTANYIASGGPVPIFGTEALQDDFGQSNPPRDLSPLADDEIAKVEKCVQAYGQYQQVPGYQVEFEDLYGWAEPAPYNTTGAIIDWDATISNVPPNSWETWNGLDGLTIFTVAGTEITYIFLEGQTSELVAISTLEHEFAHENGLGEAGAAAAGNAAFNAFVADGGAKCK